MFSLSGHHRQQKSLGIVPEQRLELRKPRLCPGDRVGQDHSLNKSIRQETGKWEKHTYNGLLYLPLLHCEVDEIVDGELDSDALGKEMDCCVLLFSTLIGRTFLKFPGYDKEMLTASGIHVVMDFYRRAFPRDWWTNSELVRS